MGLQTERKQELIGQYKINEADTGSPEVQIAILSTRIVELRVVRNEIPRPAAPDRRAVSDHGARPDNTFARAAAQPIFTPGTGSASRC